MVAATPIRCEDGEDWHAFAYAAGRSAEFPIIDGLVELARLGVFGPAPAESTAPLVALIFAIRNGDDDGRRFPRRAWKSAVELVGLLQMLVRLRADLEDGAGS